MIQTSSLFLWKSCFENTIQYKNNMIYQRKQEGLYQKRSTPASLPPVVNMPTFYFQQLKPELSKQYLDNNKQNYNNYLVIFVLIPKPAASDCPFLPFAIAHRPIVHSRASISPSNVQSFLLSKNCFVQHNMKQRGHVEIPHGHN